MKKFLILIVFTGVILFTGYAKIQKVEPLVIEAQEFVFTGEKNVAIYKGNVKVRKGDFKLTAQEIKVFLDKDGQIKKLIAKGNVKFKMSEKISGKAQNVSIDNQSQKVILKGDAELNHKNTILTGEQIIFYIKENRVLVYGGKGKKVRTIIIPSK